MVWSAFASKNETDYSQQFLSNFDLPPPMITCWPRVHWKGMRANTGKGRTNTRKERGNIGKGRINSGSGKGRITLEKDALTLERDALTLERDAKHRKGMR